MRRALQLGLAFAALLLSAGSVSAQVPERQMGVDWRRGAPRVHFSAVDLVDRSVRRKLSSGLPQTLVMRIYAYRMSGAPVAVAARSCRVTYDLWEEVYRAEVQDLRTDGNERYDDLDEVLGRCLVSRRVRVGTAADYADLRGENLYFAVSIELNPMSPGTVRRLRRWLSRPAGGGRIGGQAFFGSFVSLFVNRQIGSAERSLRFRSQSVRVRR